MLKFPQSEYEAIRHHGEEAYPHECCGILLGVTEGDLKTVRASVPCDNTRRNSRNRYNIDPLDLIRVQRQARERGLDIVGFYHSHPDHPARWSQTDLQEAHWIGYSYVITSVERGTAAQTNSFTLTGTREEDKALCNEQVVVDSDSGQQ
jgi:proteasome lid subunit RPN8/RPN11